MKIQFLLATKYFQIQNETNKSEKYQIDKYNVRLLSIKSTKIQSKKMNLNTTIPTQFH